MRIVSVGPPKLHVATPDLSPTTVLRSLVQALVSARDPTPTPRPVILPVALPRRPTDARQAPAAIVVVAHLVDAAVGAGAVAAPPADATGWKFDLVVDHCSRGFGTSKAIVRHVEVSARHAA